MWEARYTGLINPLPDRSDTGQPAWRVGIAGRKVALQIAFGRQRDAQQAATFLNRHLPVHSQVDVNELRRRVISQYGDRDSFHAVVVENSCAF